MPKDKRKTHANVQRPKKRNDKLFATLSAKHMTLADLARGMGVAYNSLYVKAYGMYDWKGDDIAKARKIMSLTNEEAFDIFLPA